MTEDIEKMDFDRLVENRPTPGEMLKQGREAKKMSHIDVAKQLKLRVQWVLDIENDHYKDAAALIYVRGYLSSYARLVNIPPDEVLQAFNELNFDEPFKVRKQPNLSEEQFVYQSQVLSYTGSKKSITGRVVRWVSVLVVLVLVALVVLWWLGQKNSSFSEHVQQNNVSANKTAESQAKRDVPLPIAAVEPQSVKHVSWKRVHAPHA